MKSTKAVWYLDIFYCTCWLIKISIKHPHCVLMQNLEFHFLAFAVKLNYLFCRFSTRLPDEIYTLIILKLGIYYYFFWHSAKWQDRKKTHFITSPVLWVHWWNIEAVVLTVTALESLTTVLLGAVTVPLISNGILLDASADQKEVFQPTFSTVLFWKMNWLWPA